MDISKYALFADVADTCNFTKSGERMGYTQPGVSHILKAMEKELGFSLFLRGRQGVSMTANARIILPLVRELLSVNEHLEQVIQSINGLETGHLTIASFASISCNWLPVALRRVQKEYPGIEVELLEGNTDEIQEWLENSRADFGLLSRKNIGNLKWLPLYEEPLVAIFPKDFYLQDEAPFPLENFSGMPVIISAIEDDYDLRDVIQRGKITPKIRVSSKDTHVIMSMVANHLGISVLPRLAIEKEKERIQYRPLEPMITRQLGVGVCSWKKLTPAARRFIALLQDMRDGNELGD